MLRNYLTTALRTLKKHRLYTSINVMGLAVGMACCLLIVTFVRYEWSFDRFHERADRIYRIGASYQSAEGETEYQNMMPPPFTPMLAEAYPAIEHATRFVKQPQDVQVGGEFFNRELAEVDASFFQIFSFPLVAGDPATALADANGMVVTTEVAEAFFGASEGAYDEALGRTVSITSNDVEHTFAVTGVVRPMPDNSSLRFDLAISFENYDEIRVGGNNWGGRTSTYIQLPPGTDADAFEDRLQPFAQAQFEGYLESLRENNLLAEGDGEFHLFIQPLPDLHHQPDVWAPYEASPYNPTYAYILLGIAAGVLLIACINFMTLSVGRSSERAREVGVRKTLGAGRMQLAGQFWGEALLLTAAALGIGLLLTLAALPFFNDLVDRELTVAAFQPLEVIGGSLGLLVVVGGIAGSYAAVLLSGLQPTAALSKGRSPVTNGGGLTRGLVVFQYALSIALIVCTAVMARQIDYLMSKDLGYDDEQVMVVQAGQVGRSEADVVLRRFRNTLLPQENVTHVSRISYPFTRGTDRNTWQDASGTSHGTYNYGVGIDFVDLMGMEIVEGRNFSRDFPSDSTQSVLVNEAFVRELGLDDPIGFKMTGWLEWVYEDAPTVIGVVKDYHFQSLKQEVEPVVMNLHPNYYSYLGAILLRVKPDDLTRTIETVEEAWASAQPGRPFNYSFLRNDLAEQYQSDQRWEALLRYASVFAIGIACLGLFGLATLSVARRTKEIGIRKVLGASLPHLAGLVTREFVVLVAVAALVAWPLAYLGMERWLSDFAYRVSMPWWVYPAAGGAALLIAVLTVSGQALRAALSDPVRAIRTDS